MSDKDKFSDIKKLVEDLLFAAEIRDLLTKTKDVISTIDTWTKHAFARNDKGEAVSSKNPNAICWCLAGGLEKAAEEESTKNEIVEETRKHLVTMIKKKGVPSIASFNDYSTHPEVMNLLDEAISALN